MGAQVTSVASLAAEVRARPARLGDVRLVCVDGPAGSGKTSLATRLAGVLDGAVVHLDDLYEGWAGLDGVEPRLLSQVLDPVAEGGTARYRRYDWLSGELTDWVEVPAAAVLVVEGCGSAARAVRRCASLVVWVEAPADVRLERGLSRDGEDLRDEWLRWMGRESVHFAREGTRESADVVVDGTEPFS